MSDRYIRYRSRSPVFNPARASLPINVYAAPAHEHHVHVVPTSRREIITNPRSSVSTLGSGGPVTTTTYKVTADPIVRTSSSRNRSSTIESNNRPTVVASTRATHRPVVHSTRPASPLLKNPYRSSEEEYYSVPASSKQADHHHRKRYSATMDKADMHRLAKERETGRLRIGVARDDRGYTGTTRVIPVYAGSAVRQPDSVASDYGDNGYGYTNPRELVQYDLNNTSAPRHHARRDSFEGGRAPRPTSMTSYQDLANPRVAYDTRERGPPLSSRGFDKIQPRGATWEQPASARMPVVPVAPMEPIQRPARVESFEEPLRRRESVTRRPERPVSLYHAEPRRDNQRDDYYESRDDTRRDRPHRNERYEDPIEQRGFGIRPERPERVERADRVERPERSPDKREKKDHKEQKEHKGSKDALAAGLGLATAAIGVNALKKVKSNDDRDDREDREARRRRLHDDDYDDEPRRRRETRDEREVVDLGKRDPRERKYRDSEVPPPPPGPPAGHDREVKPEPPVVDLSGRDPQERHNSRDERPREERLRDERPREERSRDGRPRNEPPREEKPRDDRPRDERPRDERPRDDRHRKLRDERNRDSDSDSRERDRSQSRTRRRHTGASIAAAATAATAAAVAGSSAIDSREESSASDDTRPRKHRESRSRHASTAAPTSAPAPFNPKDTMDLKALKEALNRNEASASKEAPVAQRTPRESVSKDAKDLTNIRTDLNSNPNPRGREPSLGPNKENRQLRVVSPPREKTEEKVVKSILRAPREKFPEDPSPIREGVAPLKDAKKDGVPPDARWTKISRKLVNPAALEAGKERFEEREDFVIVLRVLSRDEVQGYAEVTERIRSTREELDRQERRKGRRERHERHKQERFDRGDREPTRGERSERRHRRNRDRGSASESDTTDDEDERPKMIEPAGPVMSGGLGEIPGMGNSLREDPKIPGIYTGYTRSPPVPVSVASNAGSGRKEKN